MEFLAFRRTNDYKKVEYFRGYDKQGDPLWGEGCFEAFPALTGLTTLMQRHPFLLTCEVVFFDIPDWGKLIGMKIKVGAIVP